MSSPRRIKTTSVRKPGAYARAHAEFTKALKRATKRGLLNSPGPQKKSCCVDIDAAAKLANLPPSCATDTAYLPRVVEIASVRTLRPNPRNARTHSRKQIRQIANSIQRFGWTYGILVDEHGNILAGHGRFQAALLLGLRDVPVIRVLGLSEPEKRALALADNKIAANAGWNRLVLAPEVQELSSLLPDCNLDISITGFEAAEIDGLLGDHLDPEADPADEAPSPQPLAVSVLGDLWVLGPHRLKNGDAKDGAAVRHLMGSDLASMVFSDPPYNVRISSIQGRGRVRHREFAQGSGEMSPQQFIKFLRDCLTQAAKYSSAGSIHFVCMDWRHFAEMLTAGNHVYSELKNVIVWVKTNAGQGTFYRSQHEFIFAFKNGDAPHINNFELGQHGRQRANVWRYAGANAFRPGRMEDLSAHPTVKPVALVADAMRDCSRRGDIVLDPFMGSGTTILAAERVGRRGYGLEIDPLYVDVAIRRWQDFTKRDAVLKATGQTFDEVAAERSSAKRGRAK